MKKPTLGVLRALSLLRLTTAYLALASVCFLLCGSSALADGIYMPERVIRKIPEISAQRALIRWKDGEESLVISSALDSESQRLGWIIPLPSVPSAIAKADPGGLKTLNFCIQPEIINDLHEETLISMVILLHLLFFTGVLLFRRESLLGWFLVWICFVILASMGIPAAMGVREKLLAGASTVVVEKTVNAGAYQIAVLSSKNLGDLSSWLEENGFTVFPSAAEPIVARYIRDGWCFGAIKLSRDKKGANTPHPIQIDFKTKEAIYPMQLTALSARAAHFELFVIGEKRADSSLLRTEFCDRFLRTTGKAYGWPSDTEYSCFAGEHSHLKIGHPAICLQMWNGCVLTKLSGDLTPLQMTDDLRFQWSQLHAYRQHLFTKRGSISSSFLCFSWMFGLYTFGSMVIFRKNIRQKPWHFLTMNLLPAGSICGLVSVVCLGCLPKIENVEVRRYFGSYRLAAHDLSKGIDRQIAETPNILQGSEQQIGDAIIKAQRFYPVIANKLSAEATPGNFTVEKRNGKVTIRCYDLIGYPFTNEYRCLP